jgi:flavodoxin
MNNDNEQKDLRANGNNVFGTQKTKVLVAFFSHSGNTREIANQIHEKVGGDIFEIKPETAYPASYDSVVEQAKKGIQTGYCPALKTKIKNIENYDTVFVGTPNWWSTIAPPIATFLKSYDLSSKTVVPFCTHGGGGFGHIERDVVKLCPNSTVRSGLAVYESSID